MLLKLYLLLFAFIFFSCNSNEFSGIIPQYKFHNKESDRIHTFYIFDFITKEQLFKYSRRQKHSDGSRSFHYYFSHNANIPSSKLNYSKSIGQCHKILEKYRHSLKFVYFKNSSGKEKIVDCVNEPSNLLCRFE